MQGKVVALSSRRPAERRGQSLVAREGDELVALPYVVTARPGLVEFVLGEEPHSFSPEQARMVAKDLVDMAAEAERHG